MSLLRSMATATSEATDADRSINLWSFAVLCASWIGIWGTWLPGRVGSLQQNAIDFAEWSTFLIDVRSGEILRMPDLLRLGLMLAVVAAAVAASALHNKWLRWAVRVFLLIPAVVMLPPYPQILELWFSDSYGLRFAACSVAFVGVLACLLADRLPEITRRIMLLVLAVLSASAALWSYLLLRVPFTIHFGREFGPGWGTILFMMGLAAALALQARTLIQLNQKSPAH